MERMNDREFAAWLRNASADELQGIVDGYTGTLADDRDAARDELRRRELERPSATANDYAGMTADDAYEAIFCDGRMRPELRKQDVLFSSIYGADIIEFADGSMLELRDDSVRVIEAPK